MKTLIFKNPFFSGTVQDYSIIVPPTASREEILARLGEFGGLTSHQRSDSELKGALSRYLREKHPIHSQVRKIPAPQLKKLYSQISMVRRQRYRMETAIVTSFFKHHPHRPLTALQEALQELTSNIN